MHERLMPVKTMSLLHFVKKRDKESVRNLISQNKKKINIDESDGLNEENPLFLACCYGDEDIVELLLSNGANVNFKNAWNATPLFGAVDNNNLNIVRLLIRYGAMLNVQNDQGDTVLHLAAYRGFCDIVRLLLRHGAPVTCRNNSGKSCLNEAESRGHIEIADILKQYTENIGQSLHSRRQLQAASRQQNDQRVNEVSLVSEKQSRDAPNLRTTRSLIQTSHPSFVNREWDNVDTRQQQDKDTNCSHYSQVQLDHESSRHRWTNSANGCEKEGSEYGTLGDTNWNIPPITLNSLHPQNSYTSIDSNFNSISSSDKKSFYSNKDIFR